MINHRTQFNFRVLSTPVVFCLSAAIGWGQESLQPELVGPPTRYFVDVEHYRFGKSDVDNSDFYPIPQDAVTRDSYLRCIDAMEPQQIAANPDRGINGPAALMPVLAKYGATIKLLLAGVVVLPPAIAMGFTLPFFVKSGTDLGGRLASVGICAYALNTLGGVFGLWFTSTYLIHWLGAQSTMIAVAAANGLIAIVVFSIFRLGKWDGAANQEKTESEEKSANQEKATNEKTDSGKVAKKRIEQSRVLNEQKSNTWAHWQLLLLSFVSGLIVLSFEVLLLRLIALVVPSSYHTTSAMLANVILILAVSSGMISFFNWLSPARSQVIVKWTLICGLAGAAVFISLCPKFIYDKTDQLVSLRYLQGLNGQTIDSINHFWMLVFGLVASVGGVALLCAGLVFPSIMSMSSKHDPSGDRIGLLLAANGVGGLIGSELSNSMLIGYFGIYQGFAVLALVAMLTAAITLTKINRALSIYAAIGISIVIFVGHRYSADLPYLSPRTTKKYKIEATYFGREGVLMVVNDATNSRSIMVNNQYLLGSSGVAVVQRRQLVLPWLLHPNAKTVCSLGLATGISASGLEVLKEPPAITAVELSANVKKISRLHFEQETLGLFERAGNEVVVEDARTYMAAADNQFDLISGDLFRPYGAGEGRLYSIEHFTNVRRALTDDGLFCQWLPIYQLNRENFEIIAATFQKVFPETMVIYANLSTRSPVLGLVARKNDQKWQAEEVSERLSTVPQELLDSDIGLASAKVLVVGVLKQDALNQSPINTLDNLRVEISAGNFWILKDLRNNRTRVDFEKELISGVHLIEFNRYLEEITSPVLPTEYFQMYKDKLRATLKR